MLAIYALLKSFVLFKRINAFIQQGPIKGDKGIDNSTNKCCSFNLYIHSPRTKIIKITTKV